MEGFFEFCSKWYFLFWILAFLLGIGICGYIIDKNADVIETVLKNVYSPYNGLIENINYENVSTLNFIVYDKYRLLGLNLTTDDFNEENIDGLTKVIGNICIYYTLQKLGVDTLEINFIMESDDIIKKLS